MRTTLLTTALLVALVSGTSAAAEEGPHKAVVSVTERSVVLLDPTSVKVRRGHVSAWVQIELKRPEAYPDASGEKVPARSLQQLWAFQCGQEESSVFSMAAYEKQFLSGALIVHRDFVAPSWQLVAPNTTGASLLRAVCELHQTGYASGLPSPEAGKAILRDAFGRSE